MTLRSMHSTKSSWCTEDEHSTIVSITEAVPTEMVPVCEISITSQYRFCFDNNTCVKR